MEIEKKRITDLLPADYNPRLDLQPDDEEYQRIKRSIESFGYVEPVIWNKRNQTIVGGHQRIKVLQEMGYNEIDVSVVDLDSVEERTLNIALNKIEGGWDFEKLAEVLLWLDTHNADLELTGFSEEEIESMMTWTPDPEDTAPDIDEVKEKLSDRFLIPPFTILDTKQGYWQDRKKLWLQLGIQSEIGRGAGADKTEHGLTFAKSAQPAGVYEKKNKYEQKVGKTVTWDEFFDVHPEAAAQGGTSIFDPVLCELCYRWFCPDNGTILDPFAGGSVRGITAAMLDYTYTGIDLRKEQIQANQNQWKDLDQPDKQTPTWISGNSKDIPDLIEGEETFDMIFSCPPYYDLEVYSDNEQDLSTYDTYEAFMEDYADIIQKAVAKLKDNRFAVFVVGDIRDKKGFYRNFISDTIAAFEQGGAKLYNEAILINAIGSLAIRAGRQFSAGRKLGKQHQNVLIFLKEEEERFERDHQLTEGHQKVLTFYKGNPKEIRQEYGDVNVQDIIDEYETENTLDGIMKGVTPL